ncbi:MAG: CPBP family intramembrane metalloprotease [Bacteroidetes bacterium]|nr:CPBP family intramembrane metalloprotease [Bacteroidota bacterium]
MTKSFSGKLLGLALLLVTYQAAEAFMYFYNDAIAFLSLMASVLVLAHIIARQQGFGGIQDYKLAWQKDGKYLFVVGLLSGFVTYSLSFVVSLLTHREMINAHNLSLLPTLGKVVLFSVGTFLPSIAEDIITRGYVFAVFGKNWNKIVFVLVSALFYVLNHPYKLAAPDETLIYLFITGVFLAIPLALTNSLWYSIGLHWACNVVYRITKDVLDMTYAKDYGLSSLTILMLIVLLSIPFNIYILKRLNYRIFLWN